MYHRSQGRREENVKKEVITTTTIVTTTNDNVGDRIVGACHGPGTGGPFTYIILFNPHKKTVT